MLSGEFKHGLDPKNRLFIPAKHREELTAENESFMVAKSIRENCLKVYSMSEWEAYISPITKMERKDSERILRALHRDAAQVTPDSQGRIVLSASLLEYAEIKKETVVVGCSDYCELWSVDNYRAEIEGEDSEEIRAELERLGL